MWIVIGHFEDGERYWSKWKTYTGAVVELKFLKTNGGTWCIISNQSKDLQNFF